MEYVIAVISSVGRYGAEWSVSAVWIQTTDGAFDNYSGTANVHIPWGTPNHKAEQLLREAIAADVYANAASFVVDPGDVLLAPFSYMASSL